MNTLRWGLIGYGDIVRKRVGPALRDLPNCSVRAISRRNAAELEQSAREIGAEKTYADWHELLRDPEIDAVYIATPVNLHREQAVAAAEAGKHVLCEKPMALNVSECDQMIDAARRTDVELGVAYYRHYYPVIDRIRQIIASGRIGVPSVCQINAFESFFPGPEHPRRWIVEKSRAGGGVLMDFGCHRIEVLMNLFGPPAGVAGGAGKLRGPHDVEDSAAVTLEFGGRMLGSIVVCRGVAEKRDSLEVFGSGGSIHVPSLNDGRLIITDGEGRSEEVHPPHENLHLPLIDAFTRSVLEGAEFPVDGLTGRAVQQVIDKIYENL